MSWNRQHLRTRGTIFLAILVLLGTTYLTGRELFYRFYVLSITQDLLNELVSVRIESIGSVRASLDGEVTLKDTEAFTHRNGERKLFYRAKSVTLSLNGFPGTTENLRLLRVDLEEPEIYLRRDIDGIWNASWAFQPPPKRTEEEEPEPESDQKEAPPDPESPPEDTFPPEGIRISRGIIHIEIKTSSGKDVSWKIDDVSATLVKKDATLHMNPLKGKFYGGRFLAKKAEFIPGNPLKANLQVTITGASVEHLSAPLKLSTPATGTLDAVFTLTSSPNRTKSHTIAAGQIEIRDADLWELPVFFSVLSFLALDPISERKIDTAHLLFTAEKDRFRVDQMDFLGFPVSLFGEGEMWLAGDNLEVVFIPRLGRKGLDAMLPIIGTPIQWLLDIAKGVFVPLILKGSFQSPEISVKPGYKIAAPLQKLIEKTSSE